MHVRLLALLGSVAFLLTVDAAPRPNIVLMFIDNVGYGDLGCYGNRDVKTPNIDRLASEGVRCTDFYIGSPSCSPSRASLLTGRYPERNGLTWQLRTEESFGVGLRHSEKLIPAHLKPAGYATACFGKWNIGFGPGSRPTERGFDEFFGHASGNMHYYTHVYDGRNDLFRGTNAVSVDGYSTDLFAGAACDFIRRHAEQPFFVYVPFNAAHYPNPKNHAPGEPVIWQAPAKYFERYGWPPNEPDEKRRYRAVLTALDDGIGRIVKQVDDLGLRDRTLVIVLSDNGAFLLQNRGLEVASNQPLRDGGVTVWEGGVRVPCVMRWPGNIPAGSLCREPLISLDLLPTFLKMAGMPLPGDRVLDGKDALPALAGKARSPHPFLCWQWRQGRKLMAAIRSGRYKLVRTDAGKPFQLFDLAADIGETADLSSAKPEVAAGLQGEFAEWLKDVNE